MVIRLSEKYFSKGRNKFYFDFSDYCCEKVVAIYDKDLNVIRPSEVEVRYCRSVDDLSKSEILGFFCAVTSFDNEYDRYGEYDGYAGYDRLDEYDGYAGYDRYGEYDGYAGHDRLDEYGECTGYNRYEEYEGYDEYDGDDEWIIETRKKDTVWLLDLCTSYICFDGMSLYELYALDNDGEIVVLFREIGLNPNGTIEYENIVEDGFFDTAALLFDCGDSRDWEIYYKEMIMSQYTEIIDKQRRDGKFYIITSDFIIYYFNCIDFFEDPDSVFENKYWFSKLEAVIKESYSLEELLEIERMEQSSSDDEERKGRGKVYRKSLFDKNSE